MAVDEPTGEGPTVEHDLTLIAAALDRSLPVPCVRVGRRGLVAPAALFAPPESGRPIAIASPRSDAVPRPLVVAPADVASERTGTLWTLLLPEALVASGALVLIAVLLAIGADLRRDFASAPLVEETFPATVRAPKVTRVESAFVDARRAPARRATPARAVDVTRALRRVGIDGVTASAGAGAEIVLLGRVESEEERSLSLAVASALARCEGLVDRIVVEPE